MPSQRPARELMAALRARLSRQAAREKRRLHRRVCSRHWLLIWRTPRVLVGEGRVALRDVRSLAQCGWRGRNPWRERFCPRLSTNAGQIVLKAFPTLNKRRTKCPKAFCLCTGARLLVRSLVRGPASRPRTTASRGKELSGTTQRLRPIREHANSAPRRALSAFIPDIHRDIHRLWFSLATLNTIASGSEDPSLIRWVQRKGQPGPTDPLPLKLPAES